MKNYIPFLSTLLAIGLAMGGSTASAQALKIGTVDMNKVFQSHPKTKDAEKKINDFRDAARKDLDGRMESYNKSVAEVKKLNDDIEKPELSKENKDAKSKARDEKVGELKAMQQEITELQRKKENDLKQMTGEGRASILGEINKVVAEIAKTENFHLVFDKSGLSFNGVPTVLYSKEEFDFTSNVIAALAKGKGKEAAAPAKPEAVAPDKAETAPPALKKK